MYGGYYGYGYYWDPTYFLVLVGLVLCLGASALVNSTMRKYSKVRNMRGLTGAEAARNILNREGLYNVQIECLNSDDGDHYDPRTDTVRLSYNNFNGTSVTAVSVAAHECGHAIQHAHGYAPMSIRAALVPVVNIGSNLSIPLIFLGVLLSWNQTLIQLGIWAFALTVIFQLVTLPVEFNASRRAIVKVEEYGLLGSEEVSGGKKVLTAAALTYVAGAASSALQLLRLILLYGGNSRRGKPPPTDTREIIVEILLDLEKGQDFSHKLIKAVLDKYDYLDPRDKAFIKRVTEGTIERQLELDYYLNRFSSVPVRKMKPLIRCLLRMSTYQILYMDAVPDSAVCNEACKLAAKRGFRTLKGFVNAVLRNISRSKDKMPLPDPTDPVKYFSVKYSMPEWIVNLWLPVYGTEGTETLLMGLLKIHPVSLRFCLELSETDREDLKKKIEATGVHLSAHKELPYVYLAENLENVSELPGFAEGKFTVQDASSALAVKAAKIKPGDFVMDLCAAPGGKTILAAEYTKETGHVLSRDVSEYKTALILENLERMHRTNVKVEVHDATVYDAEREASADVVLMDVPCSGLGVMGKKRDIKYHVTPEGLKSIHELQRQIVEAGWRYVKPGGVLLYSTCTINREENQNMAAWITEKFPFVLEEERQLLPGTDETDGFYFARLRRRT